MFGDESRGYSLGVSAAPFDSSEFVDFNGLYPSSLAQTQGQGQDLAALQSIWANYDDSPGAGDLGRLSTWYGAEHGRAHEDRSSLLLYPPGLDLPFDESPTVTVVDSDDDTTTSATSDEQTPYEGCRWHESAHSAGIVSGDGHIFTNTAGAGKLGRGRQGGTVKLATLCMVFDHNLRRGGKHQYNYAVLGGDLGPADGAGFVFDSKVRRNNIQRMRSVFLNRRGQLCVRDHQNVTKLGARLPELSCGAIVVLVVDLDNLWLQFTVYLPDGSIGGTADVSAAGLFGNYGDHSPPNSGFFCAVVTKDVTVALT